MTRQCTADQLRTQVFSLFKRQLVASLDGLLPFWYPALWRSKYCYCLHNTMKQKTDEVEISLNELFVGNISNLL